MKIDSFKEFPLISVIVATKNEEKNIKNCLKSIKDQNYPQEKIEIIVIDNNSQDKTREIARKYTDKVFNLKEFLNPKIKIVNFRGAQLNLGVKKSNGQIIFFPDTDMTFDRGLLKESVDFITKNNLKALYIPEVIKGNGLFGKIRNFERSFYDATNIDAVRITTKKLFYEVGGFDEENISFGPDDWDFTKKIRMVTNKIGISNCKINHHEENISFFKYVSKKKKYINTFDGYIQKWGINDLDIKKQFGFQYRFFGVFIEEGKWKKLLSHPILASGMFFLRFLVGFNYFLHIFSKK